MKCHTCKNETLKQNTGKCPECKKRFCMDCLFISETTDGHIIDISEVARCIKCFEKNKKTPTNYKKKYKKLSKKYKKLKKKYKRTIKTLDIMAKRAGFERDESDSE